MFHDRGVPQKKSDAVCVWIRRRKSHKGEETGRLMVWGERRRGSFRRGSLTIPRVPKEGSVER